MGENTWVKELMIYCREHYYFATCEVKKQIVVSLEGKHLGLRGMCVLWKGCVLVDTCSQVIFTSLTSVYSVYLQSF